MLHLLMYIITIFNKVIIQPTRAQKVLLDMEGAIIVTVEELLEGMMVSVLVIVPPVPLLPHPHGSIDLHHCPPLTISLPKIFLKKICLL